MCGGTLLQVLFVTCSVLGVKSVKWSFNMMFLDQLWFMLVKVSL